MLEWRGIRRIFLSMTGANLSYLVQHQACIWHISSMSRRLSNGTRKGRAVSCHMLLICPSIHHTPGFTTPSSHYPHDQSTLANSITDPHQKRAKRPSFLMSSKSPSPRWTTSPKKEGVRADAPGLTHHDIGAASPTIPRRMARRCAAANSMFVPQRFFWGLSASAR